MSSSEEWSIQQLARAAGTTSRTLRHYDQLGLLRPSRIGDNGYRYYDSAALLRLQRILLLRELGLGLPVIGQVLAGQRDAAAALRTHLELLEVERVRLARLTETVRETIEKVERGEALMAEEMFEGFDHSRYKAEVIERWGKDAYERGDKWWRSLSEDEKRQFGQLHLDIAADFGKAMAAGREPASDEVQAIVERHYGWIKIGWQGREPSAEAYRGLAEMYVNDPRFAANYDEHGEGGAKYVRDAMNVFADRRLK
ncbi:MAG TPA: TipAS antibiotic-recognition domain-containing protein [Trueperaceae bacterium]